MNDKKLYLFTQDHSWRGSIVVVAADREAARELMQNELNYDEGVEIKQHDLSEGFKFVNLGDS